jgi:hypothetical protein
MRLFLLLEDVGSNGDLGSEVPIMASEGPFLTPSG